MSVTLSIVMATHNRRDVLLHTLEQLGKCGLPRSAFETIVVDNDSEDGTADALAHRDDVRLIGPRRNLGSCAKALGVEEARGEFVLFLDDDSHPRPGSVERMLALFESRPRLGAAGFRVFLPDGSQESSALPHVFVGCGVGLRRRALHEVGGLDASFFMQAEEYDLALRLLAGGWDVEVFDDLHVDHLKTPQARLSARTLMHDARNNLRVVARYFPEPLARIYREEWTQRYTWLAALADQHDALRQGLRAGRRLALLERWRYRAWRMTPELVEHVLRLRETERAMLALRVRGAARVTLVDLGKNVYAFWRAARAAGLQVTAIADDRFCRAARSYRGVPLLPLEEALCLDADAFVIGNHSFAHAERRRAELLSRTRRPVHCWTPLPVAAKAAAGAT